MFLTSPNLVSQRVRHGFFTRKGGVSEGIYASLNCAHGSSDVPAHIEENRRRVAHALDARHLMSLYQIHSPDAVIVETPWALADRPKADAMVTRIPGITLGVLAADCVPVLFADAQAGVIGAAHAGWKGATGGVLQNTLKAMVECGASLPRIAAAIGPCITQASYEVDDIRRKEIISINDSYKRYFIPSLRQGHWMFDLPCLVSDTLAAAGVQHINRLENNTCMEESTFFSFRRATHRGEADYGRQISAIMLQPY